MLEIAASDAGLFEVPVFAVSTYERTYRQLTSCWGVRPVLAPKDVAVSYETLSAYGKEAVLASGEAFVLQGGLLTPAQDQVDHRGGEQHRKGVHLGFDRIEPEGIRHGKGAGADHTVRRDPHRA